MPALRAWMRTPVLLFLSNAQRLYGCCRIYFGAQITLATLSCSRIAGVEMPLKYAWRGLELTQKTMATRRVVTTSNSTGMIEPIETLLCYFLRSLPAAS